MKFTTSKHKTGSWENALGNNFPFSFPNLRTSAQKFLEGDSSVKLIVNVNQSSSSDEWQCLIACQLNGPKSNKSNICFLTNAVVAVKCLHMKLFQDIII